MPRSVSKPVSWYTSILVYTNVEIYCTQIVYTSRIFAWFWLTGNDFLRSWWSFHPYLGISRRFLRGHDTLKKDNQVGQSSLWFLPVWTSIPLPTLFEHCWPSIAMSHHESTSCTHHYLPSINHCIPPLSKDIDRRSANSPSSPRRLGTSVRADSGTKDFEVNLTEYG